MKNTLVQYQGGRYDGCFWEWNYFFMDESGKFRDVFSSGHSGCDTAEKAAKLLVNDETVYKYDLTNPEKIKEFSRECNPPNISGVLQWFEDNETKVEFFVVCSVCNYKILSNDDLVLENWHGCGGIAVTADVLLCSECHAGGLCDCCGEYVGKDDIFYLGGEYNFGDEYKNKAARKMLDDGYGDICDGCLDCQAEQIEADERGELLAASLAIGTPDLFSNEMRWMWGAV